MDKIRELIKLLFLKISDWNKRLGIIEEYNIRRERGNQKISAEDFLPINRFMSLDSRAYQDGAIPSKYKELMGLSGSMILRCNDCITYHIIKSAEAGCTRDEITEALNIGLVIGGSVVIPHLRYALEVMEEISGLRKNDDNKNSMYDV